MVAIRKFMFDTEFLDQSLIEEAELAPPPEPTYSQLELEAARAESFADGRKKGLSEAATASDRLAAEALDVIARQVAMLKSAQDSALDVARRDATAIAAAIASKIAPAMVRAAATDSIVALVAERLPDLMEEPRIVVRIAPAQLESVKTRVEQAANDVGFLGKFILLAEDGLEAPDCRIEWADGGTERITPRVAAEIDRLIARYVTESLN